jgi:hypothetical protein
MADVSNPQTVADVKAMLAGKGRGDKRKTHRDRIAAQMQGAVTPTPALAEAEAEADAPVTVVEGGKAATVPATGSFARPAASKAGVPRKE